MVNEMTNDYFLNESLEEKRLDGVEGFSEDTSLEADVDDSDNAIHDSDNPSDTPSSDTPSSNTDGADPIQVAVDWVEFEGALENNSPDLNSFLNLVTGDVIRVFNDGDETTLTLEEAETSDAYLLIDPISSREQYRWMEEFIEVIEDATLKDKLNIAIDGKGAFRRFKDVLMGYPTERERWFAKRSAKLHTHMAKWLKEKNIVHTNTPPWETSSDIRKQDDRYSKSDTEAKNWRECASDLRAMSHDLLDIIPSRELPTVVAFLEFLKGRRGHRRTNHN